MAFGDSLRSTDGATVKLDVDVSELSRLEQAEAAWRDSVGQMSRESLRLSLAQERLNKSLVKTGAESAQTRRATIALKDAEEQSARAADRSAKEHEQLARAQRQAAASSTGLRGRVAGLTSGLASLRGGVGALGVGMIGAGSLSAAFIATSNAAADLEEEVSKSRVTFGESSREVEQFAMRTSRSLGIARVDALAYSSTLGGILNASGLVRSESAKLGTQFVQLGGDMASFNNASPVDTLEAIRAGLVGEYEPLRRYQVLLSEARVSQEALRISGKESKAELTEREKVLARVNLIMRGTVDQQGDAARTSGNYAGQMRRLNAQLRDLQTSGGELALPVLTDLVSLMVTGTGAANDFAGALRRLGRVEIPGTSSGLGSIAMEIATRTGPYGSFRNLHDLIGLLAGDDDEPAPSGRAPHGRGGSLRGPALAAQREAERRRRNRRTITDVLLDEARAEATAGTGDDVRFKRERRTFIQREINALERRKKRTKEQKEKLARLYGELGSVNGEIAAIIDRREAEQAARDEAAVRRREERRRRDAERLERIMDAAERTAQRRYDLLGKVPGTRAGMRKAALAGVKGTVDALNKQKAEQGMSAAEVRATVFEAMTSMRGTMNQFGGNLFASGSLQVAGAPNPELFSMVTELREQTSLLSGLASSTRHPGTRYVRNELAAAFDGPTF